MTMARVSLTGEEIVLTLDAISDALEATRYKRMRRPST